MKILFLPAYTYPEQFPSSYLEQNLNDALAKKGFLMEAYAPTPSRGIADDERLKYKKEKIVTFYNGMYILHRFSMYKEGKNPFLRAIRYFLVCINHFNRAVLCSKDIDVLLLVSTPPIQGAMGVIIKKIKKCKFIYVLQDIFPDSLISTGLAKKNGILWKIGRIIENYTYKNVDKVIVISKDFKNNIKKKGVPEDKIALIYNWVDEQKVVFIERTKNKLFDKYNLDRSKFYITYCGNIGHSQNMDLLLEIAKDLESFPDIYFVIVGEGAYKNQVELSIINQNIKNIKLIPFQPYNEISSVFSIGDVGLIISKPGVGENSVPSKTWSILSASCPVLANFDENELKTIIEENNCGVFTKAGDKVAFKNAIINLYNNRQICKQYGINGRKYIMDNLTKEVGTGLYIKVLEEIVKPK